ncbi:quinohemoprotein amine dehydrogenase maturation protein [Marinobacterium sedimentorum]|uniref:quinohemoprotein amine dehydrogenase maturation protein n=1 Tax=Marinobacterium sedimentorum TaxID=2927804 RepID=UPI0020C71298|nr:quinohemoprotein amine dehydrogenase maturation protein [Marinobacterium sedimentorum]MCP8686469.1 quinohemoprotein amine dehydrogenase maturation protein [Marinobacterium sedimentorum]
MGTMSLVKPNLHRIDVDARQMLFHVPSSSIFELDELSREMLGVFDQHDRVTDELLAPLVSRFGREGLDEALAEFKALEMIVDEGVVARINATPQKVTKFPLTTVVLNVNTGCNLSCTYCYKEDLTIPSKGELMGYDTAIQSVEMLLRESPDQARYNVVFFGGEPLSNMPLIRGVVDYCEERFAALDATVDFTLTTNATLLNEKLIDWFNAHRFGLTISMDGPKAMHDKNRITVGGQGTYDVVKRKVELLLSRYTARPVGCRVTLTRGVTDVERIFDHLYHELGFAEVGFGPVTSGDIEEYNLTADEQLEVFAGMKRLGLKYLEAASRGENFGFGNMHQMLTDMYEGNKKLLPCGAGVGLLAVDKDGGLNLCHRFTGSDMPLFGNVKTGIDKPRLAEFVEQRLDRSNTGCETCRIRNLCSGGCYHESYAKYGDPSRPAYHYCDLLRDWIDYGVEVYSRIMLRNPGFFEAYVSPRRSA